jgi:hypothetical protein
MNVLDHMSEGTKHTADAISVGIALTTLAAWLPPLAALFTIIWTAIRIYETKTVQGWLGRGNE